MPSTPSTAAARLSPMHHIVRMQLGTPLLINTGSDDQELQICICSISEDLQKLSCREQDSPDIVHEAALSTLTAVDEEATGASREATLKLSFRQPATGKTSKMSLICASQEDLVMWREGLQFLLTAMQGAESASTARTARGRAAVEAEPRDPPRHARASPKAQPQRMLAAQSEEAGAVEALLRKKEAEIAQLHKENASLRETVQQKDRIIAQLLHDTRSQTSTGKTESTSRESDDHLRVRESVILRRKNQRLRAALQSKQQTITQLMQLLQSVMGKSSDLLEMDDGEDSWSDGLEGMKSLMDSVPGGQLSRASASSTPATPSGGLGGAAELPASVQKLLSQSGTGSGRADGPKGDGSDSEEMMQEEMQALAGRLEQLEREMVEFAALQAGPQAAPRFDFSAVGGVPPGVAPQVATTGSGPPKPRVSPPALEALARELEMLEEKKRVVERLAKNLDPPSDTEDDGFPLR